MRPVLIRGVMGGIETSTAAWRESDRAGYLRASVLNVDARRPE